MNYVEYRIWTNQKSWRVSRNETSYFQSLVGTSLFWWDEQCQQCKPLSCSLSIWHDMALAWVHFTYANVNPNVENKAISWINKWEPVVSAGAQLSRYCERSKATMHSCGVGVDCCSFVDRWKIVILKYLNNCQSTSVLAWNMVLFGTLPRPRPANLFTINRKQ